MFFLFHNKAKPPAPWPVGGTRNELGYSNEEHLRRTKSLGFLVSERNVISGENRLCISLSLWTVWEFPNPRQFQLTTFKELERVDSENPLSSSPFPG